MNSGGKFREDINPNDLKYKLVTPIIKWPNTPVRAGAFCCLHASVTLREPTTRAILYTHAQRTVIYGVVIVSKKKERTNQTDGFKMIALEYTKSTDCFTRYTTEFSIYQQNPRTISSFN